MFTVLCPAGDKSHDVDPVGAGVLEGAPATSAATCSLLNAIGHDVLSPLLVGLGTPTHSLATAEPRMHKIATKDTTALLAGLGPASAPCNLIHYTFLIEQSPRRRQRDVVGPICSVGHNQISTVEWFHLTRSLCHLRSAIKLRQFGGDLYRGS